MSKKFTIESTKKFIDGLFNGQRFGREHIGSYKGRKIRTIKLSNGIVIQEFIHGMGTSLEILKIKTTYNRYNKKDSLKFIRDELNKQEEIHDLLHEYLLLNV